MSIIIKKRFRNLEDVTAKKVDSANVAREGAIWELHQKNSEEVSKVEENLENQTNK